MSVYEYVFFYETSKGQRGCVRADSITEAIERVEDYPETSEVTLIKRANELDDGSYGVIEFEDMWR